MSDTVKQAVATAVFNAIRTAISEETFVSWPCEIQRVSTLESLIFVRWNPDAPREGFVIKVKGVY